MTERHIYICPECGSNEIGRDATVTWSRTEQAWIATTIHDDCMCQVCQHDFHASEAVEVPLMTYDEARAMFKLDRDGDSWGLVQQWRFAIADEYEHNRGGAPAAWEYKPGLGGSKINDPRGFVEMVVAGMTDEDLRRLFGVLTRYRDKCVAAGLDY